MKKRRISKIITTVLSTEGMKKKGVSPVVATTLLVAIVVIIALVIFLWFRGIVGDYGEKFGKNIELVCDDVLLGASYDGTYLYITNDGNVPVFKINLKISTPGGHETANLDSFLTGEDLWPSTGLDQGSVFSGDISGAVVAEVEEITLVPILLGVSDKGDKKSFTCDEKYGYEINLM